MQPGIIRQVKKRLQDIIFTDPEEEEYFAIKEERELANAREEDSDYEQ